MDRQLNNYLEKMDARLGALPASERADILNEIKSEMAELSKEGLPAEKIVERLGNPKELAKAYLGDSILRSRGFKIRKFIEMICFCGYVGLGGMFVLPITGVLGVSFMLCGIISPIAGLIKLVGGIFGIDVPWIMFQFGTYSAGPAAVFLLSAAVGIIFFLMGWGFWKIAVLYVKSVTGGSRRLANE